MDDEPIYYVTKEKAKDILATLIQEDTKLGIKYVERLAQEQKKELRGGGNKEFTDWVQHQIEDLNNDIKSNAKMIWRADMEEGYNLFWITADGNLNMRRCSRKDHDDVYKLKKIDYLR